METVNVIFSLLVAPNTNNFFDLVLVRLTHTEDILLGREQTKAQFNQQAYFVVNYVLVLLTRKRMVHSFDWIALLFFFFSLPHAFPCLPALLSQRLLLTVTEVMRKISQKKNIDLVVLFHQLDFYLLCQCSDLQKNLQFIIE